MNYLDYKTRKPISREQYISNGLERGELLFEYQCGCVIIQDRTTDAYIVYCHKHKAAPDLYEALHKIRAMSDKTIVYDIANTALAKVDNPSAL